MDVTQQQQQFAPPAEGVQPQEGQGTPAVNEGQTPQQGQEDQQPQNQESQQQQDQQQPIDYEKAYKNLEKEFTKKSQRLKDLENWAKFQERTGITAEQALQQLDYYQGTQQPPAPPAQGQGTGQAQAPETYTPYSGYSSYNDPRVSQLEQELYEIRRQQQLDHLRQKFPQFQEHYADVINLADSEGLDLETAFGKVVINNWDKFVDQTKQQVVNNIRAKGTKQLESSQAPDQGNDEPNLSAEEMEAAKAMGIDPAEYAKAKEEHTLTD